MTVIALDTEITTWNKGNVYDTRNKFVCYSYASGDEQGSDRLHDGGFERLQRRIEQATVLALFNGKFDLSWFRKIGIDYSGKRIWDCQLAEFVLNYQTERYPSLEGTAVKYELGHKIDIIKEQYWDKGINTDEIPWEILSDYATQDAVLTLAVYHRQVEEFKKRSPNLFKLFNLMNHDLLVLQDMEWNGLKYDKELCEKRSKELEQEIQQVTQELSSVYPDVPINFNSGDQLSAFLYGGTISEEKRIPNGNWKSGKKAGEIRFRTEVVEHVLPRLVTPHKGSELKKEGVFGTSADLLKTLKVNKKIRRILDLILKLSELEKLNGTYYVGIPKLCEEMCWEPDMIHGQFNQVTARTGRLSAIKPNQQNMAGTVQDVLVSRYDN